MSPINQLSVLAFAATAFAVPHAQWQPFKRHAHPQAPAGYSDSSDSAPYPYSSASGSAWGTGWAKPTGGYPAPSGTGYATGAASASTSICTETSTQIFRSSTEYSTYYVTHTITQSASSDPSAAPVGPVGGSAPSGGYGGSSVSAAGGSAPSGGSDSGSTCAPDVTVTTTEKTTIYVTAGASSASAATSAPSSEVSAVTGAATAPGGYTASPSSEVSAATGSSDGSLPSAYSGIGDKAHSRHHHKSSETKAAPTTAAPSPVTTSPAASKVYTSAESAASSPSSAESPSAYSSATTSSSSASSSSTGGGSAAPFSGKRGLAYNDVSLTEAFLDSSKIGWGFNWASSSDGLSSKVSYIPELHTMGDTGDWAANAQAAIDAGSEYLFSFNEPDMTNGANLSPEAAASAWMTYMEPFKNSAKLVAPAVTNSGSAGQGLDWLKQFMAACSGCTIHAVNQHWYDTTSNDVDYFKTQISNAASQSGLPVFVGEFGAIGSDSDISSFMEDVMPWMDSNGDVLGYAYFMVAQGLLVGSGYESTYTS